MTFPFNNVLLWYLNINFIRNKFADLNKIVDGNLDVLCKEETNLDEYFPYNQFVHQHNQFGLVITENQDGFFYYEKV